MGWFKKKAATDKTPGLVDDSTMDVDTDTQSPLRWGLAILLIGFGGFVLWAGFAPLDAGVTASATVEVAGNRKTIQHLEGGTVDAILVHEGERVKTGQVLMQLDATRIKAEQSVVSAQYIAAKAIEARLLAERDGLPAITQDPEVVARFHDDPRFAAVTKAQAQLFHARREALQGEIAILRKNLKGAEQRLIGLGKVLSNRKSQITFINRELTGVRELAKEGYLPRNRMFELERDAAQLQATLSNDVVQHGQVQNQIAELKLRIAQRSQDYQKEVQSELSNVSKEASVLASRLSSLDYSVRETQIRSPIDGFVQNLNVHTIGGVIGPGTILMEVVPIDYTYIVRAKVPIQAIDKIRDGLHVDITFPAFNHARTPNIPGTVLTVSADSLVDEATQTPYYLARVQVTPEGVIMLGPNDIRPGMPATVLIRTGERTMLSYLLKPFLERLNTSFKEQ